MDTRQDKRDAGIRVITDNWLLQSTASLLARTEDPLEETHSLLSLDNGLIAAKSIREGAVQVACLASLIEQIVFCDGIHIMTGHTDSWLAKSSDLNRIWKAGIVQEFDSKMPDVQSTKRFYLQ